MRIAVIFGGRSGEHEVSIVTGASIIKALKKKYKVTPIGIDKEGHWWTGPNIISQMRKGSFSGAARVVPDLSPNTPRLLALKGGTAKKIPVDIAFIALHGSYGEDGTVQGLMEMAGIPYVGAGVAASANAMDKHITKQIFAYSGIPHVPHIQCTRLQLKKDAKGVVKTIERTLSFPLFVKPARLGSSVGITKVKKSADILPALRLAAKYDSSIVIEQGIDAREIEFSVLGNEEPTVSVGGEIVPCNEFYDFEAKYINPDSQLLIPAPLSAKKMKEGQELAVKAYRALQCKGMARVDLLLDRKTGTFYLNEINTIPGFTSISMYSKLWAASGLSYEKLLDKLISFGLAQHKEKEQNQTEFDSGSDWYKKS